MNRKIIYLINPISGTSKKEGIKKLIEKETIAQNIPFEILPTNARGDYDFIKEKIITEQITDVVIIGGDGTINQVTNALKEMQVRFGIIPFGSGNGLAFAAGISKKPEAALAVIFSGKPKFVDAFLINDYYSCMLSGVGFDAQVAHNFAAKETRGLFTYTQQSLINFFKANPYQFEVMIDDFAFYTDAFAISIANSNQFGNNLTIAPKANLNDGLLDVVIIQKMNKAKLPFALLKQIRGNNRLESLVENITNKNVIYFQTPSLIIKNLMHAPLHIDGEPRETPDVLNIHVVNNCFQLLQP
jgi:YegS/Rv2252/BmrU family lipid kinase